MKERIIINKQKMKLYNKNALDKLGVKVSNENYEITDEDTLVDFIKEQFNNRKLTTNFAGILQELKYCIEFEQLPETYDELKELLKDNNKVEFVDTSVKDRKYIWVLTPLGEILLGFVVDNDNKVEIIDTDKIIPIAECYQTIKNLIQE